MSNPKEVYTLREVSLMTKEPLRVVQYRAKKGWLGAYQPTGFHGKFYVKLENIQLEFPRNWTDLLARLEFEGHTASRDFEEEDDPGDLRY